MSSVNNGIQISGGSFNATQVAVGTGSRVVMGDSHQTTQVMGALEELQKSIAESDLSEDKRRELRDAASAAQKEVSKPHPEKSVIERSLQLIEKSAGSIAAVGAAIAAVMSLLAG